MIIIKLFYVDWCLWCQKFKPTWIEFKNIHKDDNILFVDVNCTNQQPQYDYINGYPTISIYNDNEYICNYEGTRNVNDLNIFIKKTIKYIN